MNTQLIDSIVQVIQALPKVEQQILIEKLNQQVLETNNDITTDEEIIDDEAWELWQTLGDDAVPGKLENPSINHDRYLYGKNS